MRMCDVILFGPVQDVSGIAEVNRNLFLALTDLGVKVKLLEIPNWSHLKADLHPEIREKIEEGLNRNDLGPQPAVIHSYPPTAVIQTPYLEGSGANVTYTLFETDRAPILWKDILNSQQFVENWIPCNFMLDAYTNAGIDKTKLRVIHMGVDTDRFNPNVKPMNIENKTGFTFMTSLDWSVRKNPQAILLAYLQEFAKNEDTTLIVKAYTGWADEGSRNKIRNDINKMRAISRSKAKILFISDFLHADRVPSLHKAADCWVNLSRGEGWDMGALQSMSCGVPVVGANNTAHLDYLNEENGYPVKCTKVQITNKDFLARTPNFLDSSWWEADIKDARRAMRQAYDDGKNGKLAEKGKEARETALGFTWRNTASQVIFNLGKYYN